jgi:seryl-tRNA synthetase
MMDGLFKNVDVDPIVFAETVRALDHWSKQLETLMAESKVIKEEIKGAREEVDKWQGELKDMALTMSEKRREKKE